MNITYINPDTKGKAQPVDSLGPAQAGVLAYADGVNWNPLSDGVARWVMWTGTAWTAALNSSDLFALKPIWDSGALGAAVQNITSPTLDGNTHGGYFIQVNIVHVASASYYIFANGDTTLANYSQTANFSGVGTASAGYSVAVAGVAPLETDVDMWVHFSPQGWFTWNAIFMSGSAGAIGNGMISGHKNATLANLTSITLSSSAASGYGVNSRVRMWRMK